MRDQFSIVLVALLLLALALNAYTFRTLRQSWARADAQTAMAMEIRTLASDLDAAVRVARGEIR